MPGSRVASYASTGDRTFVSDDGHTTFALVYPRPDPDSAFGDNPKAEEAARTAIAGATVGGASVHLTGFDALQQESGGSDGPGVLFDRRCSRPDRRVPLVFTGDLANEFLVDYQPERSGGETFYSLPRLPPGALRSLLVRGLDTCHREVGVFEAWSLGLVQPYAVAVDTYMWLPETFLGVPDRKEQFARAIFGSAMPSYVLARPKTRAQVGGSQAEGGTLDERGPLTRAARPSSRARRRRSAIRRMSTRSV